MAATNIRKLAQGNRNVWPVDPRVLKMKWNARDDTPELLEHIAGISLSIRTKGFDPNQPITVYDDGEFWTVSDGHCRLRATLLAIKDLVASAIAQIALNKFVDLKESAVDAARKAAKS